MKALLVALLMVLVPEVAAAKCASYAETLLTPAVPAGTPTIVFEVYSMSEETLAGGFTLVSTTGKKVPVVVKATHRGMRQTQVELVPQAPLAIGAYRVHRDTRPTGYRRESHELRVVAATEKTVMHEPVVVGSSSQLEPLGCGPDERLSLSLHATTHALAFVRLTAPDGATQDGFVRVDRADDGASLAIGHGMCSGEFTLVAGTEYRVGLQWVADDGSFGPSAMKVLTYRP